MLIGMVNLVSSDTTDYLDVSSIQINRKLPSGFSEEFRSAVRMWILNEMLT